MRRGLAREIEGGIEPKEARGKNIKIRAVFVRHGEKATSVKTSETGLTERGRQESAEFGRGLGKRDAIKPYTTDTKRTRATSREIVGASPTEKKMKQRIRDGLRIELDETGPFFKRLMQIKKEIIGEDFQDIPDKELARRTEEAERRQTNYYLGFGEKRPDPNTYSPVEAASRVAQTVNTYIKMPERLNNGSEVDLVNAAHDMPISVFLSEVMVREVDGNRVIGFDNVDEIGGPIRYNEGFELDISTDQTGDKVVRMFFRNQAYDIDTNRLQELVEISRGLKDK